eukprot:Opistho-2@55706
MDWKHLVRRRCARAVLHYRRVVARTGLGTDRYAPAKISLALAGLFMVMFVAALWASEPRIANNKARTMEAPLKTEVSIIVPTFKEAENVKMLCERIFSVCREAGISAELIIVDDNSEDGTDVAVSELAVEYPVRLHTRRHARGLSSAVLLGFELAKYDTLVVMDADLSHPPETIPAIVQPILNGEVEFALGSRYTEGGGTKDWPLHRRIISYGATVLARPLVAVSDPMSGFFWYQAWHLAAGN